jgi:hypothetical protein
MKISAAAASVSRLVRSMGIETIAATTAIAATAITDGWSQPPLRKRDGDFSSLQKLRREFPFQRDTQRIGQIRGGDFLMQVSSAAYWAGRFLRASA